MEEATDGADVVPLLALGSLPNLVISDLRMPGMSGLAVLLGGQAKVFNDELERAV